MYPPRSISSTTEWIYHRAAYITKFKYDAAGNCTEKKTADGTVFSYSYDQNYNITAVTSTVNGRKVTEKYEYDGCGNVIKYTDVMGRDTLYTYDSMNRVKTETGFDGTSVEYFYDEMGNVEEERYSNGSSVLYKYDICGRCTEVTETGRKTGGDFADTGTNNSADIKKKIYSYTYDNMGRLSTVTDTTGKVTSQTYDSLDNVTSVTDAMSGVTKYTYDNCSRLISVENAIGAIERYEYYDNGNLKKTINSRGQETLYIYDDAGRVQSFTDELGTVSYIYDKNGNVVTVTEVKKETASDEVDKTIESDNTNTITRTYDCMNRVTSVTDSCGKTIGYGYDEVGNILYVDYPGGERVRYTYNIDGTLYEVTDTEGNRTVYEYDGNSRLTKTTRPDGSVEERSYDKDGNLVSAVEKTSGGMLLQSYEYGYDEFGNITSIKDNTEKQDISYTAEADGLGAAVEEEKIEADSEDEGAGEAGNNSSDNTGNTNGDTNNNSSQDIITTTTTTMEYNEANQLIKYNGYDVLYDSDGNMIYGPLNGEMTEFTYDCRNRLISAGEVSYSYDAENIRTTVENENYKEQYVTDRVSSLSRVLQIIRTDKTNNKNGSETTQYVYGLGLIYEKGASENTSRNNNSSDKPNTQYSKNTAESDRLLIYHFDQLGSTRKITDRAGRLLYSFSYGTYGELLSIRSGEKSETELTLAELQSEKPIYFLYNGMLGIMTDENGLYYMRQRYYDIDIKRFINQDILVGSIDNSKSLNRYAYVQGNPINYNDPFGLNPLDTLKPYANLMHGFLNIAGVLPGPLGYVADLMNAGVYCLEGNYKAAASMLIQSFNTFATGRIIGNLSRGSSKGRLLTSIFLAGTGATGIVSSGDSFLENAVGLVYSIANNKDADTVFAYLSGTICNAAGVYYGVKSFVGGYTMGSYALEGLEQEKLQKLHNTMLVERIFCYNSQCFVAGTLIKTPDGDKNIENISAGDKVYAYDEATGDIAEKEVVRTFEHEVYELYHVVIDGEEIVTTAEHPFYRVDKDSDNGNGFVGARDLKPGDQILLLEGITGTVEEVFKEELTEPVKVYNFEVKDYHTYFVGEQGVLVHNSCKGGSETTDVLYHYTTKEGAESIQKSGVIIADNRGRVFVTTDQIPPDEVNNALFMGRKPESGTHIVEIYLNDPSDINLTSIGATQPNELIYYGSIRNGRNATLVIKENEY